MSKPARNRPRARRVIQFIERLIVPSGLGAGGPLRLTGNLASFSFTYVDLSDAYTLRRRSGHRRRAGRIQTDVRYPAIVITPRTA